MRDRRSRAVPRSIRDLPFFKKLSVSMIWHARLPVFAHLWLEEAIGIVFSVRLVYAIPRSLDILVPVGYRDES